MSEHATDSEAAIEEEAALEVEAEAADELDPETRARRDHALAHVRKFGDPVLRTRARQRGAVRRAAPER